MVRERENDQEKKKRGGLAVHSGEQDNIRCLRATKSNSLIYLTRIMKVDISDIVIFCEELKYVNIYFTVTIMYCIFYFSAPSRLYAFTGLV